METKDKIIQPNHISTARYTLSVLEMNIMYLIVDELQKKMQKDFNGEYKEEHIVIELSSIDKNNNYSRIKKAIKSLMTKSVEFVYNIPNSGKIIERCTNIISGYDYIRKSNSKSITIDVPSKVSKYLCYIGGGYTAFQKTIAISLNSVYSKRLYELCCRWIDKGGYSNSITEFKFYLNISLKYNKISHLKSKVLEVAGDELKDKADLFFTYSLNKTGKKFTDISIKIHRNIKVNERFVGVRQKSYTEVYLFLNRFFPGYQDNSAQTYTDNISSYGSIEIARDRFIRLDDDISYGRKTKKDVQNLLLARILTELGALKNIEKLKTTQLKISGF